MIKITELRIGNWVDMGHNNVVWGFEDWLNADGGIKPEYIYKENATV